MRGNRRAVPRAAAHLLERGGQRFHRLLPKEYPRNPRHDSIERAAGGVGHHRPAGGHRLHRRDAEILLAGKEKGAAAAQIRPDVADGSQELNHAAVAIAGTVAAPPAERLESRAIAPFTDNLERHAEPLAGQDGKIDPLIGDQARDDEEVPAVWLLGRILDSERPRVDWRIDDLRLAAVVLPDPLRYRGGDGGEEVDPAGAHRVPQAERRDDGSERGALPGGNALARLRVALKVPAEAHRRQAIADVAGLRAGHDVLRPRAAHAEHQIVLAQVEAFEGKGEEGQKRLVVRVDEWQALHEAGAHVHAGKGRVDEPGRVDRGI